MAHMGLAVQSMMRASQGRLCTKRMCFLVLSFFYLFLVILRFFSAHSHLTNPATSASTSKS